MLREGVADMAWIGRLVKRGQKREGEKKRKE
jgi:hypothetical protein